MERESRKLIRKAVEQLDIAKNKIEDEMVPDVELQKLEWECVIAFYQWCGNVVIGPLDDLYFKGKF